MPLAARALQKLFLSFGEEPAAIAAALPQEDGVCAACLVQQVQRTLSLAELSLEELSGRLLYAS